MNYIDNFLKRVVEKLTPPPPPEALCVLIKDKRCNQWKVIECPYCSGGHYHGAGDGTSDPNSFLSHRVAHCIETDNRGYVLTRFYSNEVYHWKVHDTFTQKQLRALKRTKEDFLLHIKPAHELGPVVHAKMLELKINGSFYHDVSLLNGPQSEAILNIEGYKFLLEYETHYRRASITLINDGFWKFIELCRKPDVPGDHLANNVLGSIIPGEFSPAPWEVKRALETLS